MESAHRIHRMDRIGHGRVFGTDPRVNPAIRGHGAPIGGRFPKPHSGTPSPDAGTA